MYTLEGKRIWVAGHRGMVGSALMRRLVREKCVFITTTRTELDLRRQADVEAFTRHSRPDIIVLAAAKVGGILANQEFCGAFLYDNLTIASNVIHAAHKADVPRLLFLGSSCIYPKYAKQPIDEDALLSGALEPTNEAYAIAKIAGIKLVQTYRRQYGRDYIAAMPANLYGPGDNFDLRSSHVIPALIRKAHEARLLGERGITIWGTGQARREFLHVDDCADALVLLLKAYSGDISINVGSGEDLAIIDVARQICRIVGITDEITHDLGKPDGTPRKLMNSQRLRELGWRPTIAFADGLRGTYEWFLAQGTPA